MAHTLVTQVHNPDEQNHNDVQLDSQEQEEEQKVPRSRLRTFFSCLCCKTGPPPKVKKNIQAKAIVAAPPPPPKDPDVVDDQIALLPPLIRLDEGKKTLVLDLDETLVHSSFRPVEDADFIISIELDNEIHHVYVLKRPFVDQFLEEVSKKFEVVVFTASLGKYADPLLDKLDPHKYVRHRLFREACVQHYGNYVKDLSILGRELPKTMIIDNSPYSYIFQPDNAIPISSWFNDRTDTQLLEMLKFLDALVPVDDVTTILQGQTQFQPS